MVSSFPTHHAARGVGPHAPAGKRASDWLKRLSLWDRRALALIVFMTALRLVIIAGTGLSDTESYYLTWARFPSFSYYDHPPLIAWMLSATTLASTAPFFVRIGPVLCSALFGGLLYRLTVRIFASARAGFLAVLVVSILPAFFFTGFLANPEAPLAPLWVLFLLLLGDLRDHDESWRPLAVGAVVGVAFLAKYTAVLCVPVAVLFVLVSPETRRWLRRPSFYAAGAVALLVASPVVYWNYRHGWPSLSLHLVERMPQASSGALAANALRVLLGQTAFFHPLVFPGLLAMLAVTVHRARTDERYRLLAVAGGPTLLFFFVVMVKAFDSEPHWTMVAYVPLAVASGGWGDEQLRRHTRAGRAYSRYLAASVAFASVLGALYVVHVATPALSGLVPARAYNPDADPIVETLGWDRLREAIAAESSRLGPAAVVASDQNVLCGHLDVVLHDTPAVYCASLRRTEFDFIDRRNPPPGAPVIFVDSARYPGDPSVLLPGRDCARTKTIAVERGDRVVSQYRIYACSSRSGRPATDALATSVTPLAGRSESSR